MKPSEVGGDPWRAFNVWIGGTIIGLIAYGALVQARLDRIGAELHAEGARLQETRNALEITLRKRTEFERESAALDEKLVYLRRLLPAEVDGVAVERALRRLADRTGAAPLAIEEAAREPGTSAGESALLFRVTAHGGLEPLSAFLDRLHRLVPVVQTRSVAVEPHGGKYRLTVTLASFGLNSDSSI